MLALGKGVAGLALTPNLGTLHWAPLQDNVVDSLVFPDSSLLPPSETLDTLFAKEPPGKQDTSSWSGLLVTCGSLREVRGFLGAADGKESASQCGRHGFNPWVRKIPWRRKWQPAPVFLPGKSHGQRRLVGLHGIHGVTKELNTT